MNVYKIRMWNYWNPADFKVGYYRAKSKMIAHNLAYSDGILLWGTATTITAIVKIKERSKEV